MIQSEVKILGILNLTPDSFYDGGRYHTVNEALRHAGRMLEEGADIIDIGAFSSRPGAEIPDVTEERRRLMPVLKELVKHFPSALFSIDTFRSDIAREAVAEGAGMINDISAGRWDGRMFETIAALDVPYILMHMKGTPRTMQQRPGYTDVVREVRDFFIRRIEELSAFGFDKIILDPGFGFGKTLLHNYQLLAGLEELRIGNYPVLAGISRKSMLYKLLDISPDEALSATSAAHCLAILNGADYIRVHDVNEAKQVIEICKIYRKAQLSGKNE